MLRNKSSIRWLSTAVLLGLIQGGAALAEETSEASVPLEPLSSRLETVATTSDPTDLAVSTSAAGDSVDAGAAVKSPVQKNLIETEVGLVSEPQPSIQSVSFETEAARPAEKSTGGAMLSERGEELQVPRLEPRPDTELFNAPTATILKPEYADLWERMRAGFALEKLNTPLVDKHIQYYTQRPELLEQMLERGSRYLFYIVEEIERRGMPGELALLPFVESAMNPKAMSPAKAAGLWQFIPSTGKAFNLSQNWWVDNRRDPVHSTHAALDYLQRIYELQGGDWFLALASYNWGEGAVSRAIRRNQASGKASDYLSLNMPQETRHYVPKLMALREIVANPAAFNLRLPSMPNKAYFVEVEAPMHLDLNLAAKFAGMSEAEFISLNPAHNRPVIAARSNDQIKIPADRVDAFLEAMRAHEAAKQPFSRWQPYTLAPGESLQSLATRLGTNPQEIMRANGLRSSKVLPGTRILAPSQHDQSNAMAVMTSFDGPRILEKVQRPPLYHRVGKRETTESIARRYGITTASLRAWNKLKQEVKQGMRLMVRPASAQTLLTNETGVAKVIATEVVVPKQSPTPEASTTTNPRETGQQVKAVQTPGKAKPVKAKAGEKAARSAAQKAQTPTKAKSRPAVKAETKVKPNTSAKTKPDSKAGPQTAPKTQPRLTASSQSFTEYGLL